MSEGGTRVRELAVIAPACTGVKPVTLAVGFRPRNCLHVTAPRGLDGRVGERDSWSHDFGVRVARLRTFATSASIAVFALLVSLALASPAFAQGEPDGDAEATAYTRVIQDAVERFRVRDFSGARELFQRAHGLSPSARTLRGMGLSDFESGRYAAAVAELEAALADSRKPLDQQQRIEVQAVIAHARGFVGTLEIQVSPENAVVTLDGVPVSGQSFQLDAGEHVLRASSAGYTDAEERVRVLPADLTRTVLSLAPAEATSPTPVALEDVDSTQETAAYIVGGVGVAGVIAGSIFGVRSILKHDESDRFCGKDGVCIHERGVSAMEEARTAGDIATVAFIAGGVALGAATVLLLTAPAGDVERDQTTARVILGPGSVQLRGAF
jgi:hypothetical protein